MAGAMASIVLDPGHGGTQPIGGSSPHGLAIGALPEKAVNLAIARELARVLGGRATLTRTDDVNLGLRARHACAAGTRAFVSIHSGGAAPWTADVFVHDRADPADVALGRALSAAMTRFTGRGGGPTPAPFAVLGPERGGPARCLVEIGAALVSDRDGRLDRARLGALAEALADGLDTFAGGGRGLAYGRNQVKVSAGEYGLELDYFLSIVVGDDAEEARLVNLLRSSSSFVATVGRIDARVVGASLDLAGRAGKVYVDEINYDGVDDSGVVTKAGPHRGKHLVVMTADASVGHRFIAGGAADATWGVNTVNVDGAPRASAAAPIEVQRGEFVEGLIHETLHLDAMIQRRFPRGGTTSVDLDAFLNEEIWVRQQTTAALAQITAGRPVALSGWTPTTPVTARRDVERDFRSGEPPLTYLESFVMDRLISNQVIADGVSKSDFNDLVRRTNAEPLMPTTEAALLPWITGDPNIYALLYRDAGPTATHTLLLRRRATGLRWRAWLDNPAPGTTKEQVLTQHAGAWFPSGIRYTP